MIKWFSKRWSGDKPVSIVAFVITLLALWRLPATMGLSVSGLAGQALTIVMLCAFYLLFRSAFTGCDTRLFRIACITGALFSVFTVIGKRLETTGTFLPITVIGVLDSLLMIVLFALVYGAALILLFRGAQALTQRPPNTGKESLFSHLLGNYFVIFAFILLLWLPVWLAYWPGSISHDGINQFNTYYDWVNDTHHPLLHTLMLGSLINLGIDITADGSAEVGLAIYSVVQMVLMAAILAYACHWLRRVKAPLWARVCVTLLFAAFPLYSLWSFYAVKDVLFGGLVLLFVLQLIDVWSGGFETLKNPLRITAFIVIATLMMLMRNNGLYALVLLLPFAILWAKGARIRVAVVLCGCMVAFLLASNALIFLTDATIPCKIEFLSMPLQQIGRTLQNHPEAIDEDTSGVLETLYGTNPVEFYTPQLADPMKWATDYDAVDENLSDLMNLWVRLGLRYPISYLEAFGVQNLPYYLPGSPMLYNLSMEIIDGLGYFPLEAHSFLPDLKVPYVEYDKNLTFLGLPGVRILSDTAFYVWLCIAGIGLSLYLKQKQWLAGFVFLLAIWATCLIGPVAIMRYMLGLFYAVPVMLAAMLAPTNASDKRHNQLSHNQPLGK